MKDKIKFLAEKVMGWSVKAVHGYKCDYFLNDAKGTCVGTSDNWNPYESWADCGMLIEKVKNKYLGMDIVFQKAGFEYHKWGCRLFGGGDVVKMIYNDSPTHCITEAILRAYGYKEE